MIRGIGLDLCEIGRMARAIENPRFLERVYTQDEQARILGMNGVRRGEVAAGIFAAKEAVCMALGTGFVGFGPADVEITRDALGRPGCAPRNAALERARALAGDGFSLHVSITHEAGMASAVAILEEL